MKTPTATAASRALMATVIALAVTSHAALAATLLQGAGAVPTDARMRAAVLKYLQTTGRPLDPRKPFRVLSGPTLATGNTFGGSLEQAWLTCVVVNVEKRAPGPQEIQGKTLYLRNRGGQVVGVLSIQNWKDSSLQCDC